MKTSTKRLLTIASLCGVSLLPIWGAVKTSQTSILSGSAATGELQLLKQHLRPFESIAFQCTTEESPDGTNWKVVSTQNVKWDVKRGLLKMRDEKYRDTNIDFNEFSNINGRVVGYAGSSEKADTLNTGTSKKIRNSRGIIAGWKLEPVFEIPLNHLFYLDDGKTRLSDALNDSKILKEIQIERGEKGNSFDLRVPHTTRFVVNKSKGVIEKKIYESWSDNKIITDLSYEINESVLKNGIFFPTCITITSFTKNSKEFTKIKVDVKSLEINKKYSLNDFSVLIPSGTKITDGLHEKDFVSTQVINSIDIKDVTRQFSELSEKARIKN
jgi:hypothetical protein